VVEHVQVLLVLDVSLDVRLRHALGFAKRFCTGKRRQRVDIRDFRALSAEFRRWYVGRFKFELAQRAKVRDGIQRMILLKVRSVQPVGNRAQLAEQVFTLHVEDEAPP